MCRSQNYAACGRIGSACVDIRQSRKTDVLVRLFVVIRFVCLFVCLFVSRTDHKVVDEFLWNFSRRWTLKQETIDHILRIRSRIFFALIITL